MSDNKVNLEVPFNARDANETAERGTLKASVITALLTIGPVPPVWSLLLY